MSWFDKLQKTFIDGDRYMWLVDGLINTLIITLGALVIGVIIGTLIAITKYFCEGNKKLRVFSWLCDIYTTIIRGIPMTVLLLVFFYIILVAADGVTVAIIAFGINSGVIAEGRKADLVLIDLDTPMMIASHNPVSNLVYAADSSCVDTVICNGKILMQNRIVPGEKEIIAQARHFAAELLKK